MIVVGVDGCKAGWVATELDIDLQTVRFSVQRDFAHVLHSFPEERVACIAIDIPIGLIECRRACDVEARAVLKRRKPSVFPAPDPRIACETDYHTANSLSREICGRGVSAQAFGIYPKVCQVNALMTAELQERVIEVHPEICFWAMNGFQEICASKQSGPGYVDRLDALKNAIPLADAEWAKVKAGLEGAQSDDVLDALAAAWTAQRWVNGSFNRFPRVEQIDGKGLRAEIVY